MWLNTFKLIVTLFSFSLATHVSAAEVTKSSNSGLVASMVASPNACQLPQLEELCEMTFHIIWESPETANYCLYDDDEDEPLACWSNTNRGSATLEFSGHILEEYKLYFLLNNKTKVTVTTVTVPISGTLKQKQRAQRRRRGFWRMF